MQDESRTGPPRLLPEGDIPLDARAIDEAYDPADRSDRFDQGVIAADDTGMLAGERFITVTELVEGESGAEGDLLHPE